jgi:hypothetical protein
VKDIQSHLRHSRADTTANEYMQELPESVQQMVERSFRCSTERVLCPRLCARNCVPRYVHRFVTVGWLEAKLEARLAPFHSARIRILAAP